MDVNIRFSQISGSRSGKDTFDKLRDLISINFTAYTCVYVHSLAAVDIQATQNGVEFTTILAFPT